MRRSGVGDAQQSFGSRLARARATLLILVTRTAIAWPARAAPGQDFPNRTVQIVVGQAPGSPSDLLARIVAEQLSELWRQPVVVENRTGAGGTIAADYVAKAPANGYTLLMGGQSNLAAVATLDPPARYDPLVDFVPIARIAHVPYFVVVHAGVNARTIPELVAFARAHPGRLTYVSFGEGTFSGIAFRLLMAATNIELLEIPYRTTAQAMTDLATGRVDISLAPYVTVRQHVAAGTLRILAATGSRPARVAPDIATITGQGVPGVVVETWYGLVAPAGISANVRARLDDALDRIRREPRAQKRIEQLEYEPIQEDSAQFAAAIRADIETYARAMRVVARSPGP